jgi:hypothetical protein
MLSRYVDELKIVVDGKIVEDDNAVLRRQR